MRASTRRRITLALAGLLALVLIGWFVQDALDGGTGGDGAMPNPGAISVTTGQQIQLRYGETSD